MSAKWKRGTIKAFRNYLNTRFPKELGKWRNNQFQQQKREYGDYLYYQDRALFDLCLDDAMNGLGDYQGWTKP